MNTTPENEPMASNPHQQPADQPTTPLPDSPQAGSLPDAVPNPAAAGTPAVQSEAAPQAPAAPHGAPPQAHAPVQHPTYASPAVQQATTQYPASAQRIPDAFGEPNPHSVSNDPGRAVPHAVHDLSTDQPGAAPRKAKEKGRSGTLLAGLAVGALLGGIVGGGVAAIVSHNAAPRYTAQGGAASGTVTLNNAENATQISGVAAVATPSVVTIEVAGATAAGSGSGVIYSEDGTDGYIITNAHVVTLDGAAKDPELRVRLSDGRILDGTVMGIAPYADLAVVKVKADNLQAIELADSDKLNVGDLTVAIGAPLNLANTVTSGVVSALNRGISVGSALVPQDQGQQQEDQNNSPWDFRFGLPDDGQGQDQGPQQQASGGTVTLPVVQTDASINPGNSGGALLNGNGQLIGINVAIASPATSADGTAGSAGLGFAIPSNLAKRIADEIISGEKPTHGLLGASVADSSADTDADANVAGGLLVDVSRGGAAADAGLRAGDVVTAVNGAPADSGTSVSALVRQYAGGTKVTIDYSRDGKAGQTEATLGTLEW